MNLPHLFRVTRSVALSCGHRSVVSMAYKRYGDHDHHHACRPLIIGHGLFGHKANWKSVGKAIQRKLDNQVYAIDFRNHGDSPHDDSMTYSDMVADLEHFIREVVIPETGFDQVHLLGHSMGGKVASLFACTPGTQNLLRSVIVEDISPVTESRNIHFRRYTHHMRNLDLTRSRRQLSDDLAHVVTDKAIRQFLLTNLVHDNPDNPQKARWKPNINAIDDSIEHIMRYTVEKGSFDGPTLFVYGERSGYVTEDIFDEIRAKLFPRVEFHPIPNAGHWVHAENPGEFMKAVTDFIHKVD